MAGLVGRQAGHDRRDRSIRRSFRSPRRMRQARPRAGISATSRNRQPEAAGPPAAAAPAATDPLPLQPRSPDARHHSSFEIPLLAGPSARGNPIQTLDRDRDPGDRAADRHGSADPVDPRLPVAQQPGRHRTSGRRNRLCRTRHGDRGHRRRHRPFGRIDVRPVRLLRPVLPQRAELARSRRHRRDPALRCRARRRQRAADRLPAAARLHHHADHPDHLPLRL